MLVRAQTVALAAIALVPLAGQARAQAQPPPPETQAAPGPETEPGTEPGPETEPGTEPETDADADADADAELEAALAADAAAEAAAVPAAPAGTGAIGNVLNPDLAFIVDVAAAWFGADDPLQAGDHDPARNGFTLQQVEMSIAKAVDPYFRFDGSLVFGADGVEVEEAYATTLALPHSLQLRVGQFLTRFGRINPTHPHAWAFVDQPFALSRVFGGEGNRGPGLELSWLTPLPWFTELVISATDPTGEGTARSFLGDSERPLDTPLDVQSTAAVKSFFELSPDWSLLTGLSLATGPNPTGPDHRTDVWGADLFLTWRPITRASNQRVAVQTEWLWRRRQGPRRLLTDVSGYAHVAWRFARRWSAGARYEYGSAADAAGGDDLDPAWIDARHRATAALTFTPTEFSRVRAQGSYDLPGWRDGIWAAILSLEVAVGAHGAHPF